MLIEVGFGIAIGFPLGILAACIFTSGGRKSAAEQQLDDLEQMAALAEKHATKSIRRKQP